MKNKFIFIFFLLLSNLFILNVNSVEEFNFNVTEIEIKDNGNEFIGLKRGTIKTNDNITIKADKFKYIKSKNLLSASGNIVIIDTQNDYSIYSEKIKYNKNNEEIFSEGNTKIFFDSKYEFNSSDILFNRKNMEFSSNKKSSLKEKNYLIEMDQFLFNMKKEILKAKEIKFTDKSLPNNQTDEIFMKDGIFDISNQNFVAGDTKIKLHKDIFSNKENDPRIYASSSSKEGNITTLNKGIFTSCKKNEKCTPWSIKADKIKHDKNKRQLIYKDAILKVYDIPVLYFPKFFHPDPTVKRQSGFLQPYLNKSQTLGNSLQIPYFLAIAENKDLTLKPQIFDENIYMFQNEFRQENEKSSFIADFNLIKGYESAITKTKNSITHVFAKYKSNLDLENFSKSSLEINIEKVNSDTYLKVFDTNIRSKIKPENMETLTSEIKLNFEHEDFSLITGFKAYEDLNKIHSDRYQFAMPYYDFSKNLFTDSNAGWFSFSSSGDNHLKDTNNLRSRIINDLTFESLDFISKNGLKNNLNMYFKNIITSAKNDSVYKSDTQIEVTGIMELESSLPLVKEEKNFINYITPKISLRANPTDMKNYSTNDRKININNIFDLDRLGMSDTLEDGKSLTLGIDYKKENIQDINKYFELKLGTVFKDKKNSKIPIQSTLNNTSSNFFGSAKTSLSEILSLDYEFSIDNDLKTFEHNSLGTTLSLNNFVTTFNFIEENGKIGSANILENTTKVNLNDKNFISFATRRNREIDLTEYYDLIYEYKNDCLVAGLKYRKSYYNDRDLKPSEDIILTITFFPLTTIDQNID